MRVSSSKPKRPVVQGALVGVLASPGVTRLQHDLPILLGAGQHLHGSTGRWPVPPCCLDPSHLSTPVDHLAGVAMPGDAGWVAMGAVLPNSNVLAILFSNLPKLKRLVISSCIFLEG